MSESPAAETNETIIPPVNSTSEEFLKAYDRLATISQISPLLKPVIENGIRKVEIGLGSSRPEMLGYKQGMRSPDTRRNIIQNATRFFDVLCCLPDDKILAIKTPEDLIKALNEKIADEDKYLTTGDLSYTIRNSKPKIVSKLYFVSKDIPAGENNYLPGTAFWDNPAPTNEQVESVNAAFISHPTIIQGRIVAPIFYLFK